MYVSSLSHSVDPSREFEVAPVWVNHQQDDFLRKLLVSRIRRIKIMLYSFYTITPSATCRDVKASNLHPNRQAVRMMCISNAIPPVKDYVTGFR